MKLKTCDRSLISMPRAATSVATRYFRSLAFMRPITRSRSDCDRSLLMASASRPWLRMYSATVEVSSRVLQKMTAESGRSTSKTRSRSRVRPMPGTM